MAITRLSTIVVTLMVAVAAWGAGDATETPKGITLTADEQALVAGNNGFAFRLFQQARSQTESVVLSPLSITFSLGMMNNGAAADSQTCREICQVLGFGEAGAGAINAFCHKMLTESGTLDELTKVLIANNIYVNSYLGYRLMPAFTDKVVQNYEAVPETRDFTDGETLNVINKWASDHTEGMIEEALHPDEFDPMTISCLLNALYFKGEWTHKFDAQLTQEEPFNDFKTTVQMMQQESEFYYADNDVFQSIILPYGNKAYQMNVYLPHEGKDIDDVLEFLKGNSWTAKNYGDRQVVIKLPRFEVTTDMRLESVMAELGMPTAFTDGSAFTQFCETQDGIPHPVFIGLMKQVAKIKLDEEGTEASAVTVIEAKETAVMDPVKFIANRPFLYIISEQSTGAIFFIGQYMGERVTSDIVPVRHHAAGDMRGCYDLQGRPASNSSKGLLFRQGQKLMR